MGQFLKLSSRIRHHLDALNGVHSFVVVLKCEFFGAFSGLHFFHNVEHGVDVVWVSNHGGRQLDAGLGSMDVLPEIVQAVGGRAEIIVDGGVQRGSDVLKAICLGANAVSIGKLQGWGLAAAGAAGMVRVLEILENEMISAMGLLGITSISQLDASYVRPAEPVIEPHEMSMWINMPGDRIV